MAPRLLEIDKHKAQIKDLRPAIEVLLDGGVVAGPTETFYGLMASADRPEALERVLRMKGRDGNKPLLLLLDRPRRALCYAREIPESSEGLVRNFWPGPLTLLLRARPHIHVSLVGHTRTVGVRVEGLPAIRLLVRAMDRAVTGTSANPGGAPPARTAAEVAAYFHDDLDMILDAGPCPGGEPSTIIDASLGRPRLIRDGVIRIDQLRRAAPDLRT